MIRSLLYTASIAFAVLAIPSPLAAQEYGSDTYQEFDDGWLISVDREGKFCTAMRNYEDDDLLALGYSAETNSATLVVSIASAKSLKDGDKVDLYVTFLGEDTLDDGWGANSFRIAREATDPQPILLGKFEGAQMLRDFADYRGIAFSREALGEKPVGVYRLDGSARAVAALRKCAFEVSGLDPNDPFID